MSMIPVQLYHTSKMKGERIYMKLHFKLSSQIPTLCIFRDCFFGLCFSCIIWVIILHPTFPDSLEKLARVGFILQKHIRLPTLVQATLALFEKLDSGR